jgi:hypothetical protein
VDWINDCTTPRHNIYYDRKISSVDQAVINLVEGVSIWGVPGMEVDSFVHEVRTFDRHLPACGKVDQSKAIFIWTLMLAYRWLMYVLASSSESFFSACMLMRE